MKITGKLSKACAFAVAACLATASLTACAGGKTEEGLPLGAQVSAGTANAPEPVTASEAFSTQGIWYEVSDDAAIAKGTQIWRVFAFDGQGNVTAYNAKGIALGDLNGLTDEEIIALAEKEDKEYCDFWHEEAVRSVEMELTTARAENKERVGLGWSEDSLAEYTERASRLETLLDSMADYAYEPPQPHPYSLHVTTDDSGNKSAGESLGYTEINYRCDAKSLLEDPEVFFESPGSLGLGFGNYPHTVYDMTLTGFESLVTIVNDEERAYAGFAFDEPGTEGVKVD